MPIYILKGNKVTLRPLRKSDAQPIYENVRSPEIPRFTFIPWPYNRKDADTFIEWAQKHMRRKISYNFAVVPKETGSIVGTIGLFIPRPKHNCAEIGYWMGSKYRGHGYMTEAVGLIVRFAFSRLKFARVQAMTLPDNRISQRILVKCGFRYEGTLRKYLRHRGRYKDARMYAITREDYRMRRNRRL